jgi:hypothetical protein
VDSPLAEDRRPQEPSVGRRYRLDLGAGARALRLILDYLERKGKGTAAESRPVSDAMKSLQQSGPSRVPTAKGKRLSKGRLA